jgi:hypothetical protein
MTVEHFSSKLTETEGNIPVTASVLMKHYKFLVLELQLSCLQPISYETQIKMYTITFSSNGQEHLPVSVPSLQALVSITYSLICM